MMNIINNILKIRRSRLALCGAVSSTLVVLLSLIGPFFVPYAASEFTNNLMGPPSMTHFLGTDKHGQDLLSRIIHGGRITLYLAIATVLISGAVGILWGIMSSYTKGFVSLFLNRTIDFTMSFPPIMTALLVLAISGTGGTTALIAAISFSLAPRFARVIQGATIPLLKEDFILAAKALGGGHIRIIVRHLVPNLVAPITVLMSVYLPFVIMLESTLSFLGIGAPPDVPTWGRIIADGKAYMQVAPWLTIFPGIAIIFASLSFNLLGDGLRDLLDPRSSTRLYR